MCNDFYSASAGRRTGYNKSVRPSVCLSHAGIVSKWLKLQSCSSLENSPMTSFFVVNFAANFQMEHPKRGPRECRIGKICNFQPIGWCSLYQKRLQWPTNRKSIRAFNNCYQNHRAWTTFNGRCRTDASLEPSTKISMMIDPYCQRYDGQWSVVEQLKFVTFYRAMH